MSETTETTHKNAEVTQQTVLSFVYNLRSLLTLAELVAFRLCNTGLWYSDEFGYLLNVCKLSKPIPGTVYAQNDKLKYTERPRSSRKVHNSPS